ncbi:amidohydrolase family protein [Elongatibacter sediminis]|uniref:Amidohydrolase family protein n=1 Tax=Elongatibacter sediminis TaxID=3119006 RepID=A0AAW9R5E3_9GAMM
MNPGNLSAPAWRRLLLVLCLLPLATMAAEPERKALVGGTLISGLGEPPLRNSVILVSGERIERIGTVDSLPVPDGYTVISTEGMSVLPGLWDMHVHLDINGHAEYSHWHPTYRERFADEIMPASAVQLLLAGVTTARDLGGPLEASLEVRDRVNSGELPGPRLFVSGPFLQHEPYPGTEDYRWGISSPRDAREKVDRLADAGVDVIKMVDQDEMTFEEAEALVDQAHKRGLKVVGHAHRPEEIRLGLQIGVDNFEHTGLATAPEYPKSVMTPLRERTATGRVRGGPLYWTPTVEGLWNYEYTRDNPEALDNTCWQRGLQPDTIADIEASIQNPEQLLYFQLSPKRKPTLQRKFKQLREAGVVLLVGTDSGIPLKFHCQSTWHELDVWVNVMDVPPMEAIQSATYWPSKFMGVEEEWGTLAEGRFADIIAVRGDVLRYIALLQRVDFVMKGGTVYKQDGQPVEENL